MKYTDNAINVLATKSYKGIGRAWIVKNLSPDMDEKSIVSLLNNGVKAGHRTTPEDFGKKKNTIETLIATLEGFMDGIVAIGDDEFPVHRGKVKNSEKPIFLFYKGNLQLLRQDNHNVAVIGLKNPDSDIEEAEKEVVGKLVANGATVVSGLALGCDSIAHRQALSSGGKTVAILPSPLNNILPAANKELAVEIVRNGGLLVSEYLTDANSKTELASRYQERDRLQALFSDSIVLSASYASNDLGKDSGSRLAMGYALDYGIPRAVIYNHDKNVDDPQYNLNRQCIAQEEGITIINESNMTETVDSMFSMEASAQRQSEQSSLFG